MLELPGLHDAASRTAGSAKRTYLRATLVTLVALTCAAIAGAIAGSGAALVAVSLLLLASSIRFYLVANRPERAWYDARALAESMKTLAWRYSVGGEPFPVTPRPGEIDRRYVETVQGLLNTLHGVYLPRGRAESSASISGAMRETRLRSLDERRSLYLEGRVGDQERWYGERAAFHQRRYQLWAVTTLALEFAGVAGGVLVVANKINVGLPGIFAAAAAAAIAWVETNQYAALAHSYSNASHELSTLSALALYAPSEEDWAGFVATVEEAISREHVTWAAAGGSTGADLMRALAKSRQES